MWNAYNLKTKAPENSMREAERFERMSEDRQERKLCNAESTRRRPVQMGQLMPVRLVCVKSQEIWPQGCATDCSKFSRTLVLSITLAMKV